MAVVYDLNIAITASSNSYALSVWDLSRQKLQIKLEGHQDLCTSLQISQLKKLVLSSSLDGTARIWNITSGNCLLVLVYLNELIKLIIFC